MIEDRQLRGLAEWTQSLYVRTVRQLVAYYQSSPAVLSDEEIRAYFLYLRQLYSTSGRQCYEVSTARACSVNEIAAKLKVTRT